MSDELQHAREKYWQACGAVLRLRRALQFYAESDHYTKGPNGRYDERDTVMEADHGQVAREALGWTFPHEEKK